MDTFSGSNNAPYIFSGGTFSGNPLTMTAGIAAITYLKEHKNEIYPYLMEQGNRFTMEINDYCEKNQYPAQILNAASMLHLLFTQGDVNSAGDINRDLAKIENEFYLHLLGYDVFVPGIHIAFLSFAHKPKHVDQAIAAFKAAFEDLRADGLL
jgi:glutamate-1-semialdehyde aminotransferase